MDQHPVPRQITSFEFKLIGFMTLKQFLYLLVFFPLGFIVYKIFPIPFINILLGVVVGIFGLALAFIPVNERPLDVWMRNLIKRLISPTQYTYEKVNAMMRVHPADSRTIDLHIDSQKKLDTYLQSKEASAVICEPQISTPLNVVEEDHKEELPPQQQQNFSKSETSSPEAPFFIGTVQSKKGFPLPGMLVYVKNTEGVLLRLLKTNPHGVFATFHSLEAAEYTFEVGDPSGKHFFDTIHIQIEKENPNPITIYSKELL